MPYEGALLGGAAKGFNASLEPLKQSQQAWHATKSPKGEQRTQQRESDEMIETITMRPSS